MEHFLSRPKDRPVIGTNTVATFAAAERSEIKRTVNVSVQMGEVDVLTVLRGVSFGSVGRPDKVSVTRQTWTHQILLSVITKPKLLINRVQTKINRVT